MNSRVLHREGEIWIKTLRQYNQFREAGVMQTEKTKPINFMVVIIKEVIAENLSNLRSSLKFWA